MAVGATGSSEWQALQLHADKIRDLHLRDLFADDQQKTRFSEHAQCLARLSGLLSDECRAQMADALLTNRREILSLPNDPDTPAGLNAQRAPRIWNYTMDYSGSLLFDLRPNLSSTTSFGVSSSSRPLSRKPRIA